MNTITAIKQNVKNKNRCSVYVDGEFLLACHIDVVQENLLRVGQELNHATEKQLRDADGSIKLKQRLYGYLMYKPRTVRQTEDYLRKHQATEEEVARLIAWAREFRLLDDIAYASNYILATKTQKPMSRSAIKQKLKSKGIDAVTIDTLLEENLSTDDVLAAAISVAERKLRLLNNLESEKVQLKLKQFLQYRGFDWPVIKAVVSQLLPFVVLLTLTLFSVAPDVVCQVHSKSPCYKVRLDDAINRFQPTTIPVMSANGELYLDRKGHPQNRNGLEDLDEVWVSTLDANGRRNDATLANITSFKQPDVLFNFSTDGLEALVVGDYSYNGKDSVACFAIIRRASTAKPFNTVHPLVIPGMPSLTANYHGFYSKELNVAFFALNQKGGVGDLDLYLSTLCNGKWSPLVSLGSVVNTPLIDAAPWLAPDGRTLYFSSNGRDVKRGKMDLYVTKRIGEGFQVWSSPQNLGECINTAEDDSFLSLYGRSDSALITSWDAISNRPGVYNVQIPPEAMSQPTCRITARIIDATTSQPVPHAFMTLTDRKGKSLTTDCELPRFFVDEAKGIVTSVLRENTTYQVLTKAQGYATHKQVIGVRNLDSTNSIHLTVRMFKLNAPLASIFFERGSSVPSSEQMDSLRKLVDSLRLRSVKIKVSGYTDQLGTVPLNSTLSFKRAESVRDAMIAFGIPTSNIVAVGNGIENLGIFTGLKDHPQSRRVDVYPDSASTDD